MQNIVFELARAQRTIAGFYFLSIKITVTVRIRIIGIGAISDFLQIGQAVVVAVQFWIDCFFDWGYDRLS